MASLNRADARRIDDLTDSLENLDPCGPSGLELVVEPLQQLLAAPHVYAYSFKQRGAGVALDEFALAGEPSAAFPRATAKQIFDRYLASRDVDFAHYNPLRPEPRQRNRVVQQSNIVEVSGRSRAPISDLLDRHGDNGRDQMRVLVCDGPSLLAWVGAFQPEAWTPRQRIILRRVAGALRQRLAAERMLSESHGLRSALGAALEAIGAPAFVVSASGAVEHANASGRALLEREPCTRTMLAQVPRGRAEGFEVTPIRTAGAPLQFLVLRRGQAAPREADAVARAAQRWKLTPRQREVLTLLIEGRSNASLAAVLGISERTVEEHLRAVFEKTGVASRSALVAVVLLR